MEIKIRKYEKKDLPEMIRIWNEVVEDGIAFPQEELLDDTDTMYGFYGVAAKLGLTVTERQ